MFESLLTVGENIVKVEHVSLFLRIAARRKRRLCSGVDGCGRFAKQFGSLLQVCRWQSIWLRSEKGLLEGHLRATLIISDIF